MMEIIAIIALILAVVGLAGLCGTVISKSKVREEELLSDAMRLDEDIAQLTRERQKLCENIDALHVELEQIKADETSLKTSSKATIDELRAELETANRELNAVQKAVEIAKAEADAAKAETANAREEISKLRSEVTDAQAEARASEREAGVARREAERLQARLNSATKIQQSSFMPAAVKKPSVTSPASTTRFAPTPPARKIVAPSGAHVYDSKDFGKF